MVDNTDIRQLQDVPIANVLFPDRAGPRMLPYNVPIAAGVEFVLDLMQAQLTGKENRVQTMEIDNTRGGADVIIQMGFQRMQVCAGELQVIPIYVSGSPLQFYCDVANTLPVKFFNVPLPAYSRRVTGTRQICGGSQSTVSFIAAVPGRSIVVTGLSMFLSGDAAQAAAGSNSIRVRSADSTINVLHVRPYLPAASPATPGFGIVLASMTDIFVKLPENVGLQIYFTNALTAGFVDTNINYTLV